MSIKDFHSQLCGQGFERLTQWVMNNERIKLESLAWDEVAGWVYAFVANQRVRYIGITQNVLRSRMDSYRDLKDDRVRSLIRRYLESGELVEIYGIRRQGVHPIDLELEESALIAKYETDWNIRR